MLVKPKCVWEAVNCLKNCKQISKIEKYFTSSQTHFGFSNIVVKVHRLNFTAIYFWQFSIGTPCMVINYNLLLVVVALHEKWIVCALKCTISFHFQFHVKEAFHIHTNFILSKHFRTLVRRNDTNFKCEDKTIFITTYIIASKNVEPWVGPYLICLIWNLTSTETMHMNKQNCMKPLKCPGNPSTSDVINMTDRDNMVANKAT